MYQTLSNRGFQKSLPQNKKLDRILHRYKTHHQCSLAFLMMFHQLNFKEAVDVVKTEKTTA